MSIWKSEQSQSPMSDSAPQAPASQSADAVNRLKKIDDDLREVLLRKHNEEPAKSIGLRQKLKDFTGRKGAKSLIAILVALALGWIPLQRLLATTSAEATVNARLINVRAPIDGEVSLIAPTISIGTEVEAGEKLLHITNIRADRGRLDDLRRTINALTTDMHASEKRVAQLKGIEANLVEQRNAFQEGRIKQLEARASELEVQVSSAEAMHEDARQAMERAKKLNVTGSQTIATLLHAERDFKTSQLAIEAAKIRIEGNKIELEAAKKGLFVGDSYNDLPRSAQRLDEIRQQILDASARVEENKGRLTYLEQELATESELFSSHSTSDIAAPVRGRIWDTLTARGEEVRTGQDLLRILDCAGAVVTATVSESVYNKLWVGQPAQFRLRGERKDYSGRVVGLTGLTAAGSNFAIEQTALTREPYHVTIAVPALAERQECEVGRTGQVTFDTSASAERGTNIKTADTTARRS
ncbi:HlyD family secretion protein [Hyphomicrobium sp. NDB2Meth4]|uniref:HlyD family secretion protein n=1 Tax=Hyphomicrobium sp. NDB2Meth4 TaxID=1892846 RepID=UPI000ACD0D90|nr:HlyD family secretion protein [Hyphomicrobium sp. NDB2Meth4]